MALNQRPFWTDDVSVLDAEVVPGNKSSLATLNLSGKRGAWLYVMIGKLDSTGVTGTPLGIIVRSDGLTNHPNSNLSRVAGNVTANGETAVDVDVAEFARVLSVAATTNFAIGDRIYIGAADASARAEIANVVAIDAGVSLTVDAELLFAHTAVQADIVVNKADVFSRIWIGGGSSMAIEANYLSASDGPDAWVKIWAQTYDGDGTP